jgi:imidazolonepropionase-like amidohydrolase
MRALPLAAVALAALAAVAGMEAAAPPPTAVTLAFTDVRVFDGQRVLPRATVMVDGDHIVAVGRDAPPPGVTVVPGAGRTLLPGLIDAHAHVFEGAQLEQSLAFGVTTVLDMFTTPAALGALRAADGPGRAGLRSAGVLATAPGGHGTQYGIPIPTLTRPEEAQAFVDARLAEGSDYIKIVLEGGVAYGRTLPTLDAPTVAALVKAAHARKKLAVVHVGTHDEARVALEAGADALVHLPTDRQPPAGFGAFVAGRRAFVVPTLSVLRTLQGGASPLLEDRAVTAFLAPAARSSLANTFTLRSIGPAGGPAAAVAQLRAARVPVLCGTDAPNAGTTYGASVHDELALLVAAGLTPAEALAAATAAPARAFGLADRGRVAVGMRADLLLVEGDPTVDITRTRHIAGIWRGGVRFDREGYQAGVKAAAQPAAAPLSGPISDFEDGTLAVRFGQPWDKSTDVLIGGTSTVDLKPVPAGAGGSKGALSVTGTVVVGTGPAAWAGAFFSPGPRAFEAVDLSASRGLRFQARGDGKVYTVMAFSRKRGRMPARFNFTPGAEFAPVEVTWHQLEGLDGTDIMGLFIGQSTTPGPFALVVDDVELR